MTIEADIEALESLAVVDAELSSLLEQLGREREGLEGKRERMETLTGKVEVGKKGASDMERTRSELAVEMRQMNAQIERSRDKMTRCRTEKETLAVQRELEELRRLVRDREIDHERLGQLIDQARNEIAESEAELNRIAVELGAVEGTALAKCSELEQQVAGEQAKRKAIIGRLGRQLLSRYELIRKKRGTALAFTNAGSCSACHISLPPMLYQQLMRREELAQCPQCNRILYYRAPSLVPPAPSEQGEQAEHGA